MGDVAAVLMMAATLTGVDADLLSAVCYVESGHRVSAYVAQDGHSASYGICQIKLETARGLGFAGRAAELMDPSFNALYASLYLAKQKKRFGTWEKAVSAYNAGRPIKSNHRYVKRVIGGWHELQKRRILPLHPGHFEF